MEEKVQELTQQLAQKEETMTVLKSRTRDFVNNLKQEHASALKGIQAELSSVNEVNI